MKLYELKRGNLFTLEEEAQMPQDILMGIDTDEVYKLHNIDGMYSYVTDKNGHVYHFAAWTEVTQANGVSA